MKLKKLVKDIYEDNSSLPLVDIKKICTHSSEASKNSVFVAVKGFTKDGHDYIDEAIRKGASAIISDSKNLDFFPVPNIKVKDSKLALSRIASKYYNHPSKDLNIVGITGTNGKTTTASILNSIFKANGYNTAQLGTIGTITDLYQTTKTLTTLDPINLHRKFRDFINERITHIVMEVSSHALEQSRVADVDFDICAFTNLSREHLDYHHNMENYFLAKAKLFKMLKPSNIAIVNYDDNMGSRIAKASKAKVISISKNKNTKIYLSEISHDISGIKFVVNHNGKQTPINSSLIGEYNIENILCAFSIALSFGIEPKVIQKGVERCDFIPGRMELFNLKNGAKVIVDYAHTPDAYEKVLNTIKNIKMEKSKLYVLFGCGGDRDKDKRSEMGLIAEKYSNKMWITPDNPRTENILDINNDIIRKIKKNDFETFTDRGKALQLAINNLTEGDILVVLGKGRENYQEIDGKKVFYSDIEIIQGFINAN